MAQLEIDDAKQSMRDYPKQSVLTVTKNIINLYSKPDTSSEIVSQALFNARFIFEREECGFAYVTGADRYQGWIDLRHTEKLNSDVLPGCTSARTSGATTQEKSILAPLATVKALTADVYTAADKHSELLTKLLISSIVELENIFKHDDLVTVKLSGGQRGWISKSDLSLKAADTLDTWGKVDQQSRSDLIRILGKDALLNAERFIGVPYLWGGCSPFGIDCSALVQIAFLLQGLSLLRDADLQYEDKRFCKIEEGKLLKDATFQAGDLLVFGRNNLVNHIGIASDDARFLHASGRQCNFGTYYDLCSDESWGEIYIGAVRLSTSADLSIESA